MNGGKVAGFGKWFPKESYGGKYQDASVYEATHGTGQFGLLVIVFADGDG
jgi:hypothetical protein